MRLNLLVVLVLLVVGPALADRVAGSLLVGKQALVPLDGYASLSRAGFLEVILVPRRLPREITRDMVVKSGQPSLTISVWFPGDDKLQLAAVKNATLFLYSFPTPDASGAETAAYDLKPQLHLSGLQITGSRVRLKVNSQGVARPRNSDDPSAHFELELDLPLHRT